MKARVSKTQIEMTCLPKCKKKKGGGEINTAICRNSSWRDVFVDAIMTQTSYWEERSMRHVEWGGCNTHYSTDIIMTPASSAGGTAEVYLGGKSLYPEGEGKDAEGHQSVFYPPLFSLLPFCLSSHPSTHPLHPPPSLICGASSPCRGGSSLRPRLCPAFWSPPSGSSGRQRVRRRLPACRSRGWAGWSEWGCPGRPAPSTGWVCWRPAENGHLTWGPETPCRFP